MMECPKGWEMTIFKFLCLIPLIFSVIPLSLLPSFNLLSRKYILRHDFLVGQGDSAPS